MKSKQDKEGASPQSSYNILKMIKSMCVIWAEHVARVGYKEAT
jgi:hypothetical protein